MKIKTVTLYNCEYCNKQYKQYKRMVRHEKYCFKNKENVYLPPCYSCEYLYTEQRHECSKRNAHLRCTKTNIRYHTVKSGQRQSVDLSGCVLIPKSCEIYSEVKQNEVEPLFF